MRCSRDPTLPSGPVVSRVPRRGAPGKAVLQGGLQSPLSLTHTSFRPPCSSFQLRTGGFDELPTGPHTWASSPWIAKCWRPPHPTPMLRPSAPEPGGRAGTLLGGTQPSSRLSCQRAGLMFSISSGAPALVCPEAPSLPLLGTRRRAQPAWPPPGTRVDVEAP